jgi:hypothetical protein
MNSFITYIVVFLLFLFLSFVKGFISLSLLIFWPEKIDMSMTEHKMHHLFCSVRPPLCYYVQVWVYHLQMSMKTNTNHANVCIPIYLELLYMQLLYWTIWLVNYNWWIFMCWNFKFFNNLWPILYFLFFYDDKGCYIYLEWVQWQSTFKWINFVMS